MERIGLRRTVVCLAILFFVSLAVAEPISAAALYARPRIALTFDDAPSASTPSLLLALESRQVDATFFLVGEDAELYSTNAVAIASAGMLIGNHSYDHSHFVTATAEVIRSNLTHAQSAIETVTGVTPRWYRSPYLDQTSLYDVVLPELGLKPSWPTINPKDWMDPAPAELVSRVLSNAAPGGVVILHDTVEQTNTVQAIPDMVDGLRAMGYELVTLDDIGLGSVEGSVTCDGAPPESTVTVTAYDWLGEAKATAGADAQGRFRLERLAPGPYRVGFSSPGHVPLFWGGAIELAEAEPVVVASDHTIVGVDMALEDDAIPPVTSLTTTLPVGWVDHDVSFELTATDDGSAHGLVTRYVLDPPGEVREYSTPVTIDREGTTTVSYWSVDGACNTETPTYANVMIDKTPPSTANDVVSSYMASATVTLVPTDPMSGVRTTNYRLDSGAETSGVEVHIDAPGPHTLEFWSDDLVGNIEPTKSAGFSVIARTQLSAKSSTVTPRYRATTAIGGVLRSGPPLDRAVGAQRVRLQTLTANGWRELQHAVTGASGAVTFTVSPTSKTVYRLRYDGIRGWYRAASSPAITVTPAVAVSAPVAPRIMRRDVSYSVHGSLRPIHASGTKPVRIYRYRKVGGVWKSNGFTTATVAHRSTYSRYEARIRLGAKGRWRLRAYAPADAEHAPTWSDAYDYVTVK